MRCSDWPISVARCTIFFTTHNIIQLSAVSVVYRFFFKKYSKVGCRVIGSKVTGVLRLSYGGRRWHFTEKAELFPLNAKKKKKCASTKLRRRVVLNAGI